MLVESVLPRARQRLAMIETIAPVREAAAMMAQVSRGLGPGLEDPVSAIMTRDVAHCRPGDPLSDVWRIMKERGFQRVPIVSGMGAPIGVVYSRDVLQGLLNEVEIEDKFLLEYISGVGYR